MASPPPSSDKDQALGESPAFLNLQERISQAARTDRPVIFIGERGTGKELATARLHLLSPRWNKSYLTLNCASLTPTLIESELFGHEAGAYTGAQRQRKGRFEMADGGSLFLDEIANIPMTVQDKILRVVEYGQMERVGSSTTMQVDVRLIAATNVDLRHMAREGRFREDLLDRLSFEVITLPPLRHRREDIMLLANHFARRMASEMELGYSPEFSKPAEETLLNFPWPGNIRQLKNVVERMVYRTPMPTIEEIVFDPFDSPYAPEAPVPAPLSGMEGESGSGSGSGSGNGNGNGNGNAVTPATGSGLGTSSPSSLPASLGVATASLPLAEAVRTLEVTRLRHALQCCQFNQRKAAETLGLSYHQFRGYYRKYRKELAE